MKNSSILEYIWIGFLISVILTQLYITRIEMDKPYGIEKAARRR
jgi:hypothetical protein